MGGWICCCHFCKLIEKTYLYICMPWIKCSQVETDFCFQWCSWPQFQAISYALVVFRWRGSSCDQLDACPFKVLTFEYSISCCLAILSQTIDARITPFQTFNQMRPRTHVLIPRPMKFSARLAQQFLNVHTPSLLLVGGTSWLLISSSFPNHHLVSNRFRLNHDAIFYLVPNFPNRVGLSNVWRHETAFYTLQTPLWSCRGPTLLLLLLGCFGTGSCHLRRGWRGWIL